ncbi:MAG: FG-GAP repeat domain-containing protein [Bacillota bacterium]
MRRAAVWLLAFTVLLSACARPKSPPPAPPEPTPAPPPAASAPKEPPPGPDLMALAGPYELGLAELQAGLVRYLSQGDGSLAERLERLYDHWNLRPQDDHPRLAEADLDGDGSAEVVTALNGEGGITGTGALFVIYRRGGEIVVERSDDDGLPGVRLFDVADLTGDGDPEIAWSSTQTGAHTAHTRVLVSRWKQGRFEPLPGEMEIANARLSREGRDLLLSGGLVGSAGAGSAQRARTDRYRWSDAAFRLVDRQFAASPFAYHRLQDGIVAESFGRAADAERAFREALEPDRAALGDGMVPPEKRAEFSGAVRAFARFRLGLLLREAGTGDPAAPFAGLVQTLASAPDRAGACKAAEEWARQHPAFLEALASPYGYANPAWQPEDLCGPLPDSSI